MKKKTKKTKKKQNGSFGNAIFMYLYILQNVNDNILDGKHFFFLQNDQVK